MKLTSLRFLAVVVLLVGAAAFLEARSRPEQLPPRKMLEEFPHVLDAWVGRDLSIAEDVQQVLGADDYLVRLYQHSPDEPPIDLFIVFFNSQRTGATIHSPQNCLPGAGWAPIEQGRLTIELPDREPITVNRYIIAKGLDRQFVLYWYQAHGRVVASEYWAKFFLVADAIRINRTDGAMVRVLSPIGREESVQESEQRVVEFARRTYLQLGEFIPE
ncbi:MAG: EpsI family protein [Firmicutes bacterium]|nr:EpsI family protein [Bacillota bacterium]